jgi:DUF4097 and DUF4098 domain-containing protein YvlB
MSAHRASFAIAVVTLVVPVVTCAATGTSSHVAKSFPARPGAAVVVDVSFHEVEVTARPGDTVDFQVDLESGSPRLLEAYAPVFEDTAKGIVVRSTAKETSWLASEHIAGRVRVSMPPGMDLLVDGSSGNVTVTGDLGDVKARLDLSSGCVSVRGGLAELEVDASSGSLRAELSRPLRRLAVDLSSGSATVTGGPIASVRADTSSGSVDLAGLAGDALLDTSSGSITARWVTAPAAGTAVSADSSSGGVRLSFPRGTVLAGAVATGSGGISSDFPGTLNRDRDRLDLAGGPGAVKVTVDTSSGSVHLVAD